MPFLLALTWGSNLTQECWDLTLKSRDAVRLFVDRFATSCSFVMTSPPHGTLTRHTFTAHGLRLLVDGARLLDLDTQHNFLRQFMECQARLGWTSSFYADTMWMTEALSRAYSTDVMMHNSSVQRDVAARVTALVDFFSAAWDTTCCGNRLGGIWWDDYHVMKSSESNLAAVTAMFDSIIALGPLVSHARRSELIRLSGSVYNHWRQNMVLDTGQVLSSIYTTGRLDRQIFTYNEGMMLAASESWSRMAQFGLNINASSPSSSFMKWDANVLSQVSHVAMFLSSREITSPDGVLTELSNCTEFECQMFKGITVRYVLRYIQGCEGAAAERGVSIASVCPSANVLRNVIRTKVTSMMRMGEKGGQWRFPISWTEQWPDKGLLPLPSQISALQAMLAWREYLCEEQQPSSTHVSTKSSTFTPISTTFSSLSSSTVSQNQISSTSTEASHTIAPSHRLSLSLSLLTLIVFLSLVGVAGLILALTTSMTCSSQRPVLSISQ